jgi:hypothetical protein
MGLRAAFKKHSYGRKAFKLAKKGNFRDAMDLIDHGGDVNYRAGYDIGSYTRNKVNCNMGFIALYKNNMQALEGLLQRGLDPNAIVGKDPDDQLLTYAIIWKNKQAVNLLVKAGAHLDVTLKSMKTMREYAKLNGIQLPAAQAPENSQPGPKL